MTWDLQMLLMEYVTMILTKPRMPALRELVSMAMILNVSQGSPKDLHNPKPKKRPQLPLRRRRQLSRPNHDHGQRHHGKIHQRIRRLATNHHQPIVLASSRYRAIKVLVNGLALKGLKHTKDKAECGLETADTVDPDAVGAFHAEDAVEEGEDGEFYGQDVGEVEVEAGHVPLWVVLVCDFLGAPRKGRTEDGDHEKRQMGK